MAFINNFIIDGKGVELDLWVYLFQVTKCAFKAQFRQDFL